MESHVTAFRRHDSVSDMRLLKVSCLHRGRAGDHCKRRVLLSMLAGGCLYGKLDKHSTNSESLVHAYLQCNKPAAVLTIVLCMQAATETSRNLACNQSGRP